MDKIKTYQRILRSVTDKHAKIPSAVGNIRSIAVCDAGKNDFLLIDIDEKNREHYVVFHLHLEDEKVLIEQDGIEYGIINDLIEAGISPKDIVGNREEINLDKELLAA